MGKEDPREGGGAGERDVLPRATRCPAFSQAAAEEKLVSRVAGHQAGVLLL